MKNIAVRYAFIAFLITVVWTLFEHQMGYNTVDHAKGQYTRMLTAFVFYFFIAFAIARQKRKQRDTISFKEGFVTGLIVCVVYAPLSTLWFALYGEVINPRYQASLMEFERSKLVAIKASPIIIADKMKEVQLMSGGSFLSYFLLFVFTFLIGAIIAFTTALLVRNQVR
ncbi:DUF4199 domain-containing protein [Chitinophagaceae bacterium 26-R-25]|nr:DUF4199 domain-containing protein [Chitinophagaceae bacterium 26-R-25]